MTTKLAYSVPEVAKLLGLNPDTVRRAIRQGQIPSITVGRRHLVSVAVLDRLLARSEGLEQAKAAAT